MDHNPPDRFDILRLMRDYQPGCVLGAAAELDLFTILGDQNRSAAELADETAADPRAMAMLLDALAALGLLEKTGPRYADARGAAAALDRRLARRPCCRWSSTA